MTYSPIKKHLLSSTIFAVGSILMSAQASAQNIDYATFQEIFGEPVTLSANGKPQRSSETAVTMEILTQEQIKNSGAKNLPDLLRRVPGLDVIERARGQYDVSIRGYNKIYSSNLLVLVNGRQVYLDHYGMVNWSALPVLMEEIQQVEVVKGPNTALFGFNAVAGVINIVTKNPVQNPEGAATVTAGTNDELQMSAMATLPVSDESAIRISGGYQEVDTLGESQRTNFAIDKMKVSRFMGQGFFTVGDSSNINMDVSLVKSDQNEINPAFSVSSADYETKSAKAAFNTDLDSLGLLTVSAYRNWLDVTIPSVSGDFSNQITVLTVQDLINVNDNHTARFVGEYRHNTTDILFSSSAAQLTSTDFKIWSVGGMWDWQVSEKLSAMVSGRLDFTDVEKGGFIAGLVIPGAPADNAIYSRSSTEKSFNFGAVYKLTDIDSITLSAARGIAFPSQMDVGISLFDFATVPGLGTIPFILGSDPDLKPTVVKNIELSYNRSIEAIEGSLKVSLFHQKQNDVRSFLSTLIPDPRIQDIPVSIITNVGDSKMTGMEIGIKGRKDDVYYSVNYTYIDINDDLISTGAPIGTPIVFPAQFEDTVSNHSINATVGYSYNKWSAEFTGYYRSATQQLDGAFPVFFNAAVDNSLRIDGRVAYAINDTIDVSLYGVNLFNKATYENPRLPSGRRVMVSLGMTF